MDKKEKIRRDSQALNKFLENEFTPNERRVAMDKLTEQCMVPRTTVWNWRTGICRIPELHKCKIEEIFGREIFSRVENA